MHIIIYESYTASGGIALPGDSTTSTPQTQPITVPAAEPTSRLYARVKADVAWGLNIRSSIDTSSPGNIIASVPAGTLLNVLKRVCAMIRDAKALPPRGIWKKLKRQSQPSKQYQFKRRQFKYRQKKLPLQNPNQSRVN